MQIIIDTLYIYKDYLGVLQVIFALLEDLPKIHKRLGI